MSESPRPPVRDPVYERWRWRVFGATWLAYAGYYLTRKTFSSAKVAIGPGTAIGLSKGEMAMIDTAFSAAYAVGQIVFGVAGDKVGTRKVVLFGMLASVLAAAAMGGSSTALMFGVLFCFQGLCQATGWAPLSKNVSNFFSQRERGSVMGFWCTSYAVGGWFAGIYAAWMGERLGWRYAFLIPAASLLGIAVLFYFLQRDRPEDVGLPPVEQYHGEPEPVLEAGDRPADEPEGSWKVIVETLRSPMVLLLCAVYFCLKPARYLFLFWGPQFIHERLGAGMTASALISSTFELGGPLGAFLAGVVSDRVFGSRRVPAGAISLLALSVMLYFFDDVPANRWAIGAALFVMGALVYAGDSLLAGTAAVDFGAKKGASTASGLVNASGSLGQILGPAIPGLVPKEWGWHGVFAILAGMVLLAGLILLPRWNALPATANGRAG